MKKLYLQKIIITVICMCIALLGFTGCNGSGSRQYADPLDIPESRPIVSTPEIGMLPAHPALPPFEPGIAPFVHGYGTRNQSAFGMARNGSIFNVVYESAPNAWDFFYFDIANWQSNYTYVAVNIAGNPAGTTTQVTVATAYAEMENRPLVPIVVDTIMGSERLFIINIAEANTISAAYNHEDRLLAEQTINRLFFFVDSNPAQSPVNTSGDLTVTVHFGWHHQQRPTFSPGALVPNMVPCGKCEGDYEDCDVCDDGFIPAPIIPAWRLSDPVRYNVGSDAHGNLTITTTTNTAAQMIGAYIEFPLEPYMLEGSQFTDLSVNFTVRDVRSITVAAVLDTDTPDWNSDWSELVFIQTINSIYTGTYAPPPLRLLQGDVSEMINIARGQITTHAGTAVEGQYVNMHRMTHLRLYINSGAAYFAPGANPAGAAALNPGNFGAQPTVTIRGIEFLVPEEDGVRIGMGWFLMPGNNFIALHPETIRPGGVGTITVHGRGGQWQWWEMPVTEHTPEATLLTIRVRGNGPEHSMRIGVETVQRHRVTGLIATTVVSSTWGWLNGNSTITPGDTHFMDGNNGGRWWREVYYDYDTNIYTIIIDMAYVFDTNPNPMVNPNLEIIGLRFYHNSFQNPEGTPYPGVFDIEFLGVSFGESPRR